MTDRIGSLSNGNALLMRLQLKRIENQEQEGLSMVRN